jgi:tetratricopeptide (TPR) repeat protein
MGHIKRSASIAATGLLSAACVIAQGSARARPQTGDISAVLARGVVLAKTGYCQDALPLLRKPLAGMGKELQQAAGIARVRCAVALSRFSEAADTMSRLTSSFPDDPDVLYLAVHFYSDLSIRASQQLLRKAPWSHQVHQLNAEALEVQGKWDEAAEEYRAVLKRNPNVPGIHYLLGRVILSKPKNPTTMDDARREFEQELQIDPSNAGAEFVLGEIAGETDQLPAAIEHFSRASKLDAGFAEAFLSLGKALLEAERGPESIPALETAAKLQPDNPTAHFLLGTAYRRAGRTEEAEREFRAHQTSAEKVRQAGLEVRHGVSAGVFEGAPPK